MNGISFALAKQSFLKPKCIPQVTQVATVKLLSNSDGMFRMGKLKTKYMRKAPIITYKEDGTRVVEGVSDKQFPLVAKWSNPGYCFRGNPGEHGSGDMTIFPEPDMTRPRLGFEGLKAYEDAPEEVKNVLSLGMSRRDDLKKVVHEDHRMMVAEHKYDNNSAAVRITQLTLCIRSLQKSLALLARRGYVSRGEKSILKSLVNKRRAELGYLRTVDYPKFEWLLEKLNLVYKPRPFVYERIIPRRQTERLVNLLCDETRAFKMQSLKDSLEETQPVFLNEKLKRYQAIMEEEKKMGLKETVTEKDIEEIEQKIKTVSERLAQRQKRVIKYHIFEEKVVEEEYKILS